MNIGQAAAASGISAKMIRHYECVGLTGTAKRSAGGYRLYEPSDVNVLKFVSKARKLGFPIKDIRRLLALWQDQRPSVEIKSVALAHIADLDARIVELQGMRDALRHLANHCPGDGRPACSILENLAG